MEDTLNEIMKSVAIYSDLKALREKAKTNYSINTEYFQERKELNLSVSVGECNRTIESLYRAYRIYRIMNILIEAHECGYDIDRMYRELECQV